MLYYAVFYTLQLASLVSLQSNTVCIMRDQGTGLGLASNLTLHPEHQRYKFSSESALSLSSCMGLTRGSRYTESLSAIAGYFRAAGLIAKWKADSYDLGLQEGKAWMRTEGADDTFKKLKVLMDTQLGPTQLCGQWNLKILYQPLCCRLEVWVWQWRCQFLWKWFAASWNHRDRKCFYDDITGSLALWKLMGWKVSMEIIFSCSLQFYS